MKLKAQETSFLSYFDQKGKEEGRKKPVKRCPVDAFLFLSDRIKLLKFICHQN